MATPSIATPANNSGAPVTVPEAVIQNSTALATREESSVPGLPEELQGFSGFEGLDASSMVIIPRIKLVQPTSKEGTQGLFRINLTGEEFENLPIIVIKAMQGRTMWDPTPGKEDVLCRSYDFFVPDSSIEKPFAPACAKKAMNIKKQMVTMTLCDQARWHGETKPECSEVYNLLCLLSDDFVPFWTTIHGASIKAVRSYLSAIVLRRGALWQWSTALSSEVKTEPNKHYVTKFAIPKPLSREILEQVQATIIGLDLQNADIKRTLEMEEAQQDGGEGSDAADAGAPPEKPDWVNKG